MNKQLSSRSKLSVAVALAAGIVVPVNAQMLEEVVVTATK